MTLTINTPDDMEQIGPREGAMLVSGATPPDPKPYQRTVEAFVRVWNDAPTDDSVKMEVRFTDNATAGYGTAADAIYHLSSMMQSACQFLRVGKTAEFSG